jgi:hypothetical protein
MIQIETSTQIDRPRDEVFDFLTSVENMPDWQSGVIESRPLTPGPMRVGYQFVETAKVVLWKLNTVCTVSDLKANERFAFVARSDGPLDYEGNFELHPVAGGTRLTLSGSARLKGAWRLLQPLLASDLRKETRVELETIKRLVEGMAEGLPRPLQSQS